MKIPRKKISPKGKRLTAQYVEGYRRSPEDPEITEAMMKGYASDPELIQDAKDKELRRLIHDGCSALKRGKPGISVEKSFARIRAARKAMKVTIVLSAATLAFFKNRARKNHTTYQRLIREVLERYADISSGVETSAKRRATYHRHIEKKYLGKG